MVWCLNSLFAMKLTTKAAIFSVQRRDYLTTAPVVLTAVLTAVFVTFAVVLTPRRAAPQPEIATHRVKHQRILSTQSQPWTVRDAPVMSSPTPATVPQEAKVVSSIKASMVFISLSSTKHQVASPANRHRSARFRGILTLLHGQDERFSIDKMG